MLTLKQAVYTCIVTKPFNYDERASRAEFWLFVGFCMLVAALLSPISLLYPLGSALFMTVVLLGMVCLIFAAIRRLHDVNQTGVVLLIPVIVSIPIYLFYMQQMSIHPVIYSHLMTISQIIELIFMLYVITLLALPGSTKANRYGPPLNMTKHYYFYEQALQDGYSYYYIDSPFSPKDSYLHSYTNITLTPEKFPSQLLSATTPIPATYAVSMRAQPMIDSLAQQGLTSALAINPNNQQGQIPFTDNLKPMKVNSTSMRQPLPVNDPYTDTTILDTPYYQMRYHRPPYSAYRQYHSSQSQPYRHDPNYYRPPTRSYSPHNTQGPFSS